eukprot:scaffold1088_cov177-Ochromonas_danica.AAC.7
MGFTARMAKQSSKETAAAFSAVWTAILLIVISVIGTIIMRRYQTALSIGFLIGIIFIMTQQMLILFAIFVEQSQASDNTTEQTQAQQAMAVFTFFVFFIYASFGTMLTVFRDDVIKQEVMTSDMDYDQGQGIPGEDHPYHDENQI